MRDIVKLTTFEEFTERTAERECSISDSNLFISVLNRMMKIQLISLLAELLNMKSM